MKILQLVRDPPSVRAGGAEVHAEQLARALARRGAASAIVVCGEGTEHVHDGVRRVEAGEHDLARVLDAEQPDVVHAHDLDAFGPSALQLARERGAAVVVTLHDERAVCVHATPLDATGRERADLDAECAACAEHRSEHRRRLAHAHAVIACTRRIARAHTRAGFLAGAVVEILSPGVHGRVHEPRSRKGGKLRLGFVGPLDRANGVDVAIAAMRALAKAPVELHVHAPEHRELEPEHRELEPGSRERDAELRAAAEGLAVRFHGRFEPRESDAVHAGFDVLVAPSLGRAGHPWTIEEAFRNGLCVVATDAGGLAEIVQDGINGLHFPAGDARALASAVQRFLVDPRLYDRLCRDRPRVVTIDEVAARLDGIYARFSASRA